MERKKELFLLGLILIIAAFLRFFNLMHDAPYFFNPDERNMAIATSQFRLPSKLSEIPSCLLSQFVPYTLYPRIYLPAGKAGNLEPNLCNLNPHFFAYGQFPLYLAYFSDQIVKHLGGIMAFTLFQPATPEVEKILQPAINNHLSISFPSAIFWLRFWSALSSTLTILLIYLISSKFLTSYFSLLTSLLVAFTPGLIQSAHFGTTESLLAFFFMTSLYLSLKLLKIPAFRNIKKSLLLNSTFIILNSLAIGLAIGTKLTGLFFFIPPFLALMMRIIGVLRKRGKNWVICLFTYLSICLFLIIGSIFFAILSSPYNLIDFAGFKGSAFGYEAEVAIGRYQAFYTRQFVDTIPILFQIEKIFPYALGWPIYILGSIGLLLIMIKLFHSLIILIWNRIMNHELRIKNKKNIDRLLYHDSYFLILTSSFLIYFLPNAFLFAKWTRFMTPIFPFFTIFAGYFLFQVYTFLKILYCKTQKSKLKNQNLVKNSKLSTLRLALSFALCILSLLPGIAFMSIYTHPDSRATASEWILRNIPDKSYILFETANVVDIPVGIPDKNLPQKTYTLVSFDFYHIDENELLFEQLLSHLEKADYFFIPSRRIFVNHLRLSKKYPLITKYYQLLFSGRLGFEKTIETNSFPTLSLKSTVGWEFPDEEAEETFTVFDHPVIRIYRKTKSFTKEQYRSLFKTNKL